MFPAAIYDDLAIPEKLLEFWWSLLNEKKERKSLSDEVFGTCHWERIS